MDEQFSDFQFPIHGLDRSRGFSFQTAGTTIRGANVRAFEPSTLRGRGGSRPGLVQYIPDQLPGEIQNLNCVVTVDGTALLANYDDTPPDLYDPSSPGPVDAWPTGRFRRVPALGLPEGGWGITPWRRAPETLNIVWPSAGTIGAGTALGGSQLNAVARDRTSGDAVDGTYEYLPASGTQLPIGEGQELLVRFTPTDRQRYGITYGSNAINVVQAGDEEGIQFVQGNKEWDNDTEVTELSVQLDAPVEGGNLIVLFVHTSQFANDMAVAGIVDSQLNIWTQAGGYVNSPVYEDDSTQVTSMWYTVASSDGTLNIQVLFDGLCFPEIVALEYRGTDEDPIDGSSGTMNSNRTGTWTTGTILVSETGSLIVAAFQPEAFIVSNGTGFTERLSDTQNALRILDNTSADESAAATVEGNFDLEGEPVFSANAIGASFKKAD